MTHRLPALVAAAALAALSLSACGRKQDAVVTPRLQRLDVELDYLPNADHAGIYAAQAAGDFRRAGLDVHIHVPSDPSAPLKLAQAGKVDLAISYEPELFLARDKGAKVVGVGAIATRPLTSIIALGSAHIRRPADLEGKTIGTAGIPYQSAYLKTILARAGVKRVKEVDVGFDLVPAMLTKKVDATLGGFWNVEAIQLQRRHEHPSVIRVDQAGVPTYDELVLVSSQDTLRRRGELVRRFLEALQNGTRRVRRDPAAGVDALLKADPDLDRGLVTASVKATLPAFVPSQAGKPFGWMEPEQWRDYARWLEQNKLVAHPTSEDILTDEFLPGEGVRPDDEDPGQGGSG